MFKKILTVAALLSLAGCGNDSSDKPNPPPVIPPPPSEGHPPNIGDQYTNVIELDIAPLAGLEGQELVQGIEDQLNNGLTARSGLFNVTPKWGMTTAGDWDELNLNVIQRDNGEYVFETTIAPQAVGIPSASNAVKNGFSFLVEMPNGLVKEAVLAYNYQLSTPLGYGGDGSRTPDYLFLGGFTSGDPLVENKPLTNGKGFTYKLSTDRYIYMNTRFGDAKDNLFFNKALSQDGERFRIQHGQWNLVQFDLTANSFTPEGLPVEDGSLAMHYNAKEAIPTDGSTGFYPVTERVMIDELHNYQLAGLMEFYRHYKHSADQPEDLLEQTLQIKDITFAWTDESVELPEQPPVNPDPTPDNVCSDQGFTHSRIVDLTGLEGSDHQKIMDAISSQLGDIKHGAALFSVDRNNISVVTLGDEPALKVTYAAGAVGQDNTENGTSLLVNFPASASISSACIAYDVQYEKDVHASQNNDLVILPSLYLTDTTTNTVLAEHNYVINHNKRLGTKFNASFLTWFDGSTKYWAPNRWSSISQTLNFDEHSGQGTLDSLLNNDTHFKPINGVEFNQVAYPLVTGDAIGNVGAVASFNSYRPDAARSGVENQAFYFKNIAIGWK
ncbi:hypothetical protein MD535_18615 [Vibrio sp. ZSDZ65]|uniref:Uncharacterized protein n=1 Tax=Vibrio qingdaonensis TaxID=2829491 RepID=A0A9X3HXR4_9VIBR|nr:hypothetical protein [Vibrio qingdaonensis]MCW8348005.1 hypothetical protein [Vibrio qingdaonensis]